MEAKWWGIGFWNWGPTYSPNWLLMVSSWKGEGDPYQPRAFLPLPLKQASTHLLISSAHPHPYTQLPSGQADPCGSPLTPLPLDLP